MKRAIETMARIQSALGGILLAACLGLILLQMVSGYLGATASWAKKASLCTMIWGVFIESGALVYEKRHFAFGGLSGRIRDPRHVILWDMGLALLKLIFSILMIVYGLVLSGGGGGTAEAGFLGFGYLWLCLPVCGGTSAVYLAYHLSCDVKRFREGGSGK